MATTLLPAQAPDPGQLSAAPFYPAKPSKAIKQSSAPVAPAAVPGTGTAPVPQQTATGVATLQAAASAQAAASGQTTPPVAPASAAPQTGPVPATPTVQQSQSEETPTGNEPTTTFRIQSNEVNLIFTVTDKKGRFVTGLQRENFGLLDNGRPPVSVVGFRQQTDLPLRVGVMIDTSSSIRTRFQFEQDSAVEFFLQTMHRNDRAFVEGFDIQTNLAQDYTNSIDALNQGIHKLRPGGGTALYDALYKTCRDQMLTLRSDEAIRRALILVSDGDDNYSRAELSDAVKMCQRASTIVYTISTNLSPTKDKGDDVLQAISDATGGRAFFPNKIDDVALGFRAIEQELRSQYSLQYRPANLIDNGEFRTIYLQALDPRYHVRASKGYFAPRPAQ